MWDLSSQLASILPAAISGRVVRTNGLTASVAGFPAPVGAVVEIERQSGQNLRGEVIGFQEQLTLVHPYGGMTGIRHGSQVRLVKTLRSLRAGDGLLGRVIDAHGDPIDGRPTPPLAERVPLDRAPPTATQRPRIQQTISTGVRAIDGLLTCGLGQRMGIFAGSGVGKSVTLGMMARYTSADVNVIALIGERGREVNDFLERDLGPEGLARSVVVVATSDQPAVLRVQAAAAATAVAEYFRDHGKNVLFLMDSVTRFAMAQREIGLAAGEPPATRGYPPSVFALLPRLVERAGRSADGSITAFYTVLVEGDDNNEPISDTVRGLLDGHTVLSRRLAAKNHYPAVDVLESISRLMPDIVPREHRDSAAVVRQLLAAYRDNEDLISIGAYRQGANTSVDLSIALQNDLQAFLRQPVEQKSSVELAQKDLLALAKKCASLVPAPAAARGGGR